LSDSGISDVVSEGRSSTSAIFQEVQVSSLKIHIYLV